MYIGDFNEDQTIRTWFHTTNKQGASVTFIGSSTDFKIYKDDSITETTTGVTLTKDFDGVIGTHLLVIDTTDAFYTAGSDYSVVTNEITVDGEIIRSVIKEFSIENRSALLSAEIQTALNNVLTAYNPPTKAEMDAGFASLNNLSATDVNTQVDIALTDYDGPTKTEMDSAFTQIKGVTWSGTDTLEEIRDNLGGIAVADVWSYGTRTITGGTVDTLSAGVLTSVKSKILEIFTDGNTELNSIPAITAGLLDMIKWIFTVARNRQIDNSATNTQSVYKNDNVTQISERTITDNGTSLDISKWS